MSGRTVIEEIKERLDMLEIVGRYVDLRQVGGRWVAPCPFHNETKPSFSVGDGFYYCFGCQASGDVITFYQEINGLDFKTALAELAVEAGVELKPLSAAGKKKEQLHLICLDMHKTAQEFFAANLQHAPQSVQKYLQARGITSEDCKKFGLGYSQPDWQSLSEYLKKIGYSEEQGVMSGLLSKSDKSNRTYDRFRGRLMFPIHDLSGRVVAFGARSLQAEDEPKYLNSSDSPIYTKGEHLYGLYQARKDIGKKKSVLLTEGYVDVLALSRFGFRHACGVLGTALTPFQVRRLAGLSRRVELLFDGDGAGRKAALRSAEMILLHGLECSVVSFPEGEDADSLLQKGGTEALQDLLSGAEDGLHFCLQEIRRVFAPADILRWALQFLGKLVQPELRAYYLPRLARGLDLNEAELQNSHQQYKANKPVAVRKSSQKRLFSQREKELLAFAVNCPEYREKMVELGILGVLESSSAREFWEKLNTLSEQELLSGLSNEERGFWVQSSQFFVSENKERQWADIQDFIVHTFQSRRQEHLQNALQIAQKNGDRSEVERILREYQQTLQS